MTSTNDEQTGNAYKTIVLKHLVDQYIALKESHGGGPLPYGALARILKEAKASGNFWVNKDMVLWHARKAMTKTQDTYLQTAARRSSLEAESSGFSIQSSLLIETAATPPTTTSTTTTTTLTEVSHVAPSATAASATLLLAPTTVGNFSTPTTATPTTGAPVVQTGDVNVVPTSTAPTISTNHPTARTASTTTSPIQFPRCNNLGGRPKGSTDAFKMEMNQRKQRAMQQAAVEYARIRDTAKSQQKRAPRNGLVKCIEDAKLANGVPDDVEINPETIRSRAKLKIFGLAPKRGGGSPMEAVEPYLVAAMTTLSSMRHPITVTEGKEFVNSIIEGTSTERQIDAWKTARCKAYNKEGNKRMLGGKYWRGFMERNKHRIQALRGVKFQSERADWCTFLNMQEMYDTIYADMVTHGIAEKLDEAVWFNRDGQIVTNQDEALGLQSQYALTHPHKLVFVDEVGCNTSQSKDGNIGGQKFLCEKGMRPQQKATTKDAHFTVMCFTAATGEPIMVSIIFAAKTMMEAWPLGQDIFAECADATDIASNAGAEKRFPMGPECLFNGENVPTFCCCSENGSITSTLLAAMLESMDDLHLFDRSDGVNPFLLLDGHGSRFELPFLEYVNNDDNKWTACIGLPYGTSYWQVGDSSEQNGSFKMEIARAKKELSDKYIRTQTANGISQTDVTYLVRRGFNASFARVQSNKKAIAERGWNPLNYNCLCMPEIQRTKPINLHNQNQNPDSSNKIVDTSFSNDENVPPVELNTTRGLAGTLIGRIVEQCNRDHAKNGTSIDEIRRKRQAKANKSIEENKRMTAGLLASSGQFVLSGPEVLGRLKKRAQQAENEEREKKRKKQDEYNKAKAEVDSIRALNLQPTQLNVKQLKTLCSWYKQQGDDPIQQRKADLLTRYKETCERDDPVAPFPNIQVETELTE